MRLLCYPLFALLACQAAAPPQNRLSQEPAGEERETAPAQQAAEAVPNPPPLSPAPSPERPAKPTPPTAPKPRIVLPPLDAAEQAAQDENGRRRIGAHRELPELPAPEVAWTRGESGAPVWRVTIRSPGAVALRLHFTDFHLPSGRVVLREANHALRAPDRVHLGDGPAGDGAMWSDILEGDAAIVEYLPGDDGQPGGPPPFRIDKISHLWQSPLDFF